MPKNTTVEDFIKAVDQRNEAFKEEEFSTSDDVVFSVPVKTAETESPDSGPTDEWEFDESEVVRIENNDDEIVLGDEDEDLEVPEESPEVPEESEDVDTETGAGPVSETEPTPKATESWNFGYTRQEETSPTHAESLFREMLTTGVVEVSLDDELSGLSLGTMTKAKAEAAVLNRLRNRILKSGRFEYTEHGAKGAISMTRLGDGVVKFELKAPPMYVTENGRVTKIGKLAYNLMQDGIAIVEVAFGENNCDPESVFAILDEKESEAKTVEES